MYRYAQILACGLFMLNAPSNAAVFSFVTDPFAGTTVLTTAGRQVVGGEPFITFNIGTDKFAFDPAVFAVDPIVFVGSLAVNLPTGGVNVIALLDTPNPLNAGLAADLIAAQITDPGPGFFIYFNSGLNTPRLVYSTDLSDNTADLKIMARMTNLSGQPGAMSTFADSAFILTPEPASIALTAMAFGLWPICRRLRRISALP